MKKLIVLSLVAVMASLASAGITLVVNEAASTVSLVVDENGLTSADYAYFALVSDDVTLSGGTSVSGNATAMFGGTVLAYFPTTGASGVDGNVSDTNGASFEAGTVLVSDIAFVGDGFVTLQTSPDFTGFTSAEYYVPEPMTMGLLGLGGLFLRRRK